MGKSLLLYIESFDKSRFLVILLLVICIFLWVEFRNQNVLYTSRTLLVQVHTSNLLILTHNHLSHCLPTKRVFIANRLRTK